MTQTHRPSPRSALDSQQAQQQLLSLFAASNKHFAARLWDGSEMHCGDPPDFTLVFPDQDAFMDLMRAQDPGRFAEAYVEGRFDVEGDMEAVLDLAAFLRRAHQDDTPAPSSPPATPAPHHTPAEDAENVRAHYDLSNDFFRLFLDDKMVYSSAYFARPEESVELAQDRKLDLICRKLGLSPGDRLLDVGCGWGALTIFAARNYGVQALGITLSREQAGEARRRAAAAGLDKSVTIEERDYRNLAGESFDKIASVGMIEHVGIDHYAEYFTALYRALRPGGLLMNQGITSTRMPVHRTGGDFIRRYVFPGSELGDLSTTLARAEDAGFEILDVQSLRRHYALTLRQWARRFAAKRAEARRLVPERVVRTWELYLPGCAQVFEEGIVSTYQIVAAKPDDGRSAVPLSRERWLAGG